MMQMQLAARRVDAKRAARATMLAAVRTFNQALIRSDKLAGQHSMAAVDRIFDGGEYSDGFHADAIEQIIDDITLMVAKAYGVNAADLREEYLGWLYNHECRAYPGDKVAPSLVVPCGYCDGGLVLHRGDIYRRCNICAGRGTIATEGGEV